MSLQLTDADSNVYTIPRADFVGGFEAQVRVQLLELAFAHGARDIGDNRVNPRTIRIRSVVTGADAAAFQTNRNDFFKAMAKASQTFAYKAGRYINVNAIRVSDRFIIGDLKAESEIELTCGDPFWYSTTLTTESTWNVTGSPDTKQHTNSGNVDVFPVIEITAAADLSAGITFKNQTDGNALFTYGDSNFTSGTKLTVDCQAGTVGLDAVTTMSPFVAGVVKKDFPSVVLRPGETYKHTMIHKFSTQQATPAPAAR